MGPAKQWGREKDEEEGVRPAKQPGREGGRVLLVTTLRS